MNKENRNNIKMTSSKENKYVFGGTAYIVCSHFKEDSGVTVSEIVERLAVRNIERDPSETSKISA